MKSNKYILNFVTTVMMESNNAMFINQYNREFCPKINYFIKNFFINPDAIKRNTSLKNLIKPLKLDEAVSYLKENLRLYLINRINLERSDSASMHVYDITKNYSSTRFCGDYVGSGINHISLHVGFEGTGILDDYVLGVKNINKVRSQWSKFMYQIGILGYQQYPACCHAVIYNSFSTVFGNSYSRSILNLKHLPLISDNIFNIFNTAITTGFSADQDCIEETEDKYEMVYLISDSTYSNKFVNRFFQGSEINTNIVRNPRTHNRLYHTHIVLSADVNFRIQHIEFPEYKVSRDHLFKVQSFKYAW